MSGLRESAFLPTIKCSSCGMQVEISMMGEHACPGPGPAVELSPPPDSNAKFQDPPPRSADRMPGPVDVGAASTITPTT
ncbi:hypothetical protein A9Z42_0041270 [Trichoderma parareesei]|uniref:Uncharacterized protein n=1 Tax=Trichoderma parareesei TaxID=858221 RepID=A0A2H2ZCG8_TRIPA|nr:hypothetical protein A9Z42_0041270 [Trichoderma parareesei]